MHKEQIGLATLYLCDCMEYMETLPDKAFDLAIVDPPYGIDWMTQTKTVNTGKNWTQHEYKNWDKSKPTKDYFDALKRVSVNQIVWGGNYMTDNLSETPCWVIWDKMQEFSGAVFEMAWTSFESPAKSFRMSRAQAYCGINKIHPTQKPVKLYEWLLTNYAKPGQRILDTHLGSGSSAIACHNLGYEMVGVELDEDYFSAACRRIEDAQRQAQMFDYAPMEAQKP